MEFAINTLLEHYTSIQKKRSRLTTRDGFFIFKICRFKRYFVYLVIDLQMIKYEFQTLQPTTNDTFTLFV